MNLEVLVVNIDQEMPRLSKIPHDLPWSIRYDLPRPDVHPVVGRVKISNMFDILNFQGDYVGLIQTPVDSPRLYKITQDHPGQATTFSTKFLMPLSHSADFHGDRLYD